MTLKIYAVVLELVRKLSPYLPALRARSSALGDQLERALVSISAPHSACAMPIPRRGRAMPIGRHARCRAGATPFPELTESQ